VYYLNRLLDIGLLLYIVVHLINIVLATNLYLPVPPTF